MEKCLDGGEGTGVGRKGASAEGWRPWRMNQWALTLVRSDIDSLTIRCCPKTYQPIPMLKHQSVDVIGRPSVEPRRQTWVVGVASQALGTSPDSREAAGLHLKQTKRHGRHWSSKSFCLWFTNSHWSSDKKKKKKTLVENQQRLLLLIKFN